MEPRMPTEEEQQRQLRGENDSTPATSPAQFKRDDNSTAKESKDEGQEQRPQRPQGARDSSQSWNLVKNKVKVMGVARNLVTGNVAFENKMGYYTWDELKSGKDEFAIAVCLQFAIGQSVRAPKTPRGAANSRTTQFTGGIGFDGVKIPNFTLHEHAPGTFQSIRQNFDVSSVVFEASLSLQDVKNKPNLRVVNKQQASGKSSSWFFFSSDMRFALKTCTKGDVKCLTQILESYTDHVKEKTLLPRYFGLYELNLENGENLTFVVMNNVFAAYLDIHSRYDLKGSTAGRYASQAERKKNHPVFKDLDVLAHMDSIPIGSEALEILLRDTEWLARAKVMDYSLLLGVHVKAQEGNPEDQQALAATDQKKGHPGVVYAEDSKFVVYMGIVDILTFYKSKKRAETFFSGTLLRRNVSCQPPKTYATRMQRFFEQHSQTGGGLKLFGLPEPDE